MSGRRKQLSDPFSTGGGGSNFEVHVQASFAALMLADGFAPGLPRWPIVKIKLQGKFKDWDTDDLIVFVEDPNGGKTRRILGQIKHSIGITKNNPVFSEVIQAAWNDFNNPGVFSKGNDIIALITGPLTAVDVDHVRPILEWAKQMENAEEFVNAVELANFSSDRQREKLEAFRVQLATANGGTPVTDEDLFEFLRHFHLLGYDLDIRAGVQLSLLHSILGQYALDDAHGVWTRIVDEVQYANQNAGTISRESLPDDLTDLFKERVVRRIPDEYLPTPAPPTQMDLNQYEYARDLTIASLIGSWDENRDADRESVQRLSGTDYTAWIGKIREVLQLPNSPLSLRNGVWTVLDRKFLWETLGSRLFDSDLDHFKACAVDVLAERDPMFSLPPDERFAAVVHGKVLGRSNTLRQGLVESLALLSYEPQSLVNCSLNKAGFIARSVVREIFDGADWVLWGSLNNLLPTLAEAAPNEFLNAVESALQETPCPFDDLFAQEGDFITGGNYVTGLLWALETLAWDQDYLVRSCVVLGYLAVRDPGGNWGNRPANSLTSILLPWFPQTMAPFEKKKATLQSLAREVPSVAWKLVLSLLPGQNRTSSGSHKPKWRHKIPEEWDRNPPRDDYWAQVTYYAELAVSMANGDVAKLSQLVGILDSLPKDVFESLLAQLSSETITSMPEEERYRIWEALTGFARHHRRFSEAKWALDSETVAQIEGVAQQLEPENPLYLNRWVFGEKDFGLYERNADWEKERQKLEERRVGVVETILSTQGIGAVIRFAGMVDAPEQVGRALGTIGSSEIDTAILPDLLDMANKRITRFINGYVWNRQRLLEWAWSDGLDKRGWSEAQIAQLLSYQPFTEEAWSRASAWLGAAEGEYWRIANVFGRGTDANTGAAIDKLIEYGRPFAAMNYLHQLSFEGQTLDIERTISTLMAAASSKEPPYLLDVYRVGTLIQELQDDSNVNHRDLFKVEWAWLPLLDGHHEARPKTLEHALASDPAFFCEVIRLVYRSKNASEPTQEPDEPRKSLISNAWQLLHEWHTLPGFQADGTFSPELFNEWLETVKVICGETGHFEVALVHVGHVLFYSPPDPKGLWIEESIAEALNALDTEAMRDGYSTEVFNSRGVHTVVPNGQPERDLAEGFRKKADEVENAGYHRFAVTLRMRAEDYDRQAERIIAEYQQENQQ